tara:strand:- start:485 stop:1051 length:567 start_codon:yes stop_codon:yes gene_type:complete
MWDWLSNIWTGISDSVVGQAVGDVYDYVADSYVGQTVGDIYDDYFTDYSKDSMSNYFTTNRGSSTFSGVKTALDFAGGFMDVVAPAGATTQMPSSKRRRVSAPRSTAGVGQFNVSKSNLANLQFGYTPRVNDAIIKANASKVPSIEMAVAQMMNYKSSRGATIKLQGAKPPSVAARTKKPSFAPKYYG